MHEKVRQVGY